MKLHQFFIILILLFSLINSSSTYGWSCSKFKRNYKDVVFKQEEKIQTLSLKEVRDSIETIPYSIEVELGVGMIRYPQAASTFLMAANIWSTILTRNRLHTPIYINLDMRREDPGVLGSTQVTRITGPCNTPGGVFPTPMTEKSGITFPRDCRSIKYTLPTGVTLDSRMNYEKAHLKAIGFINLDDSFGRSDGEIVFSTAFTNSFDFDISDGIDPTKSDFLTIALHEIGHLLGFRSSIDAIDYGQTVYRPTILDMFRFDRYSDINFLESDRMAFPSNLDTKRHFFYTPGLENLFSIGNLSLEFSTGSFRGDGNQASHWKADEITGTNLGIMDPTLARGTHLSISLYDLYVFRSIGYLVDVTMKPLVIHKRISYNRGGMFLKLYIEFLFTTNIFINYKDGRDFSCIYDDHELIWNCPYPSDFPCTFFISTDTGKQSIDIKVDNVIQCK